MSSPITKHPRALESSANRIASLKAEIRREAARAAEALEAEVASIADRLNESACDAEFPGVAQSYLRMAKALRDGLQLNEIIRHRGGSQ